METRIGTWDIRTLYEPCALKKVTEEIKTTARDSDHYLVIVTFVLR